MEKQMFNTGNIGPTFNTAPVAPVAAQTKASGRIGECFSTIANLTTAHLDPEVASLYLEQLYLLRNGIVGSFVSPAWKDGGSY